MVSKDEKNLWRGYGILMQKVSKTHPGNFGMPDLFFPKGYNPGIYSGQKLLMGRDYAKSGWVREPLQVEESDAEYEARRYSYLKQFITSQLFLLKQGDRVYVKVTRKSLEFVGDIFFNKNRKVICWKPRGGGGSLMSAIVILLECLYKRMSFLNIAGGDEQSLAIFNYVKDFIKCIPGLHTHLVSSIKTHSITLKSGVNLVRIPATEKQTRSKHYPGLVADESCQKDRNTDLAMQSALQTVLSEGDRACVLLVSTFHVPVGLFQEYWDNAEKKGFTRVKWNIFDCMQACKEGLNTATQGDPKALKYCETCYLTNTEELIDETSGVRTTIKTGCNGYARDTDGWMSFTEVVEAKKQNEGSNTFSVEFECRRPSYTDMVYDTEQVESCIIEDSIPKGYQRGQALTVGIDWGFATDNSMVLTLCAMGKEYVSVIDYYSKDRILTREVIQQLQIWTKEYGDFVILADSSHPFNNADVSEAGFTLTPVKFNMYKNFGIGNLCKYFMFKRLRIPKRFTELIDQLKNYRVSNRGKPNKGNDHACDSLLCATVDWYFDDYFGADIADLGQNPAVGELKFSEKQLELLKNENGIDLKNGKVENGGKDVLVF